MIDVEQFEDQSVKDDRDERIEAVKHIAVAMFRIDDPVIGAVTKHIARQILDALEPSATLAQKPVAASNRRR